MNIRRSRTYGPPPPMRRSAGRTSARISAVTAWRVSKTPEFQEEYSRVRRDTFEPCLARWQQASSAAAPTLKLMEDLNAPDAVRVRASECVLRHASQSFELEALAARVQSVEQWMKQMSRNRESPSGRSSH